jgi:hypothetical protein
VIDMKIRVLSFSLVLLVILFTVTGCFNKKETTSTSIASDTETTTTNESSTAASTTVIISRVYPNWVPYKSLKELVDECDTIIIGEVVKGGPSFLVSDIDQGGKEKGVYYEVMPFTIKFVDGIKGALKSDDQIKIRQFLSWYDEEEIIHNGRSYLFFLLKTNEVLDGLPRYALTVPMTGWPQISDGRIIVGSANNLMTDQPVEQAKTLILDTIAQ